MRRFDVEQEAALAGALLAGAGAVGLEACPVAVLAGVLAAAALEVGAAGALVAGTVAAELCELQPAAPITAMAAIAPVSEF